ncbi:MAG: XTP/dITP diphosphatase [Deltaproteobacteria bacterium]|nr:XTP/dITP diphosphatase [Deltaproteobacteria bacterium]
MIHLLVATTNSGKFAEVQAFLKRLPLDILSLNDLENSPKVIEDGASFEENALKKARTLAECSGYHTLADDSGLEVDALNGKPGIHSARYSGEEGNDVKNNEKLLNELKNVPPEKRSARFVCALALCAPKSRGLKEWTVRSTCEGFIAFDLKGRNGFGYDPLFFYPAFGKTFGEIDRPTKATVSHRGKALQKLAEILPTFLDVTAKP